MHIHFDVDFGAVSSAEFALLQTTLDVLRADREERDFLSDLLDKYATWAFAKRQRSPSSRTTINSKKGEFLPSHGPTDRPNARRKTPSITCEECRRLVVALAVLRSDDEESGFLSWWIHEYGALAVSVPRPDPVTEEEIEENALFLQSLGIPLL
ncbi:MAG TPA: hypothetical protein VLI55_10990 [Bryobacteraceae bacterium]|nr:hypothetical protein [Bryobacteraceae bacterium]